MFPGCIYNNCFQDYQDDRKKMTQFDLVREPNHNTKNSNTLKNLFGLQVQPKIDRPCEFKTI